MSRDRDSLLKAVSLGGGVLILGQVIELSIAFVGKVLIARFFGSVGFGSIAIGLSVATMLAGVGLLGVHVGIGRFLPRAESDTERRGVILGAFQLAVPPLVGFAALVFVFAPDIATAVFHDPDLGPILRVFSGVIPLLGFVKLAIGTSQGQEETRLKVVVQNVTVPALRFGGIIVVILLGVGVYGIAGAYLVGYLVAGAIGLAYLYTSTPLFRLGASRHNRRKLLRFSLPLMLMTLTGTLLADVDTVLLGYFTGTGEVGVYNVAYALSRAGLGVLSPIAFIVMPVMAGLDAEGRRDEMDDLFKFVTKWIVLLTLPIAAVFVLFPNTLLGTVFGEEFSSGGDSLVILTIGFLGVAAMGQVPELMKSIDETGRLLLASVFAIALNLALNLVLIPPFGIEGAAVATAAAYLAQYAYLTRQLHGLTGVFPFSRRTVVLSGGTVGVVAGALLLKAAYRPSLVSIVALTTVLLLGYAVLLLTVAVDRDEIMLLLSFEEEIGVDLEPLKKIVRPFMDIDSD